MAIFPQIFFSVCFILSAAIGTYGLYYVRKAVATRKWLAGQARITHSSVESHQDIVTIYAARVEYQFTDDGQQYTSECINLVQNGSSDSRLAQKIIKKYPRDKLVPVYFKPNNPNESVLERRFSILIFAPLLFGFVGTGLSGILLYNLA